MKKKTQIEIREQSDEQITFQITGFNMKMLSSLCRYAQMLDHVTNAQDDEQLNTDGVINSILNDGMTKEIKDICKHHGFLDVEDFIESMAECQDGEEAAHVCRTRQNTRLKAKHDKVLAQIPIDDKQGTLRFEGVI